MFGGRHRGLAREKEKAEDVGKTFRRLLIYFKPYWPLLIVAGALLVLNTSVQLLEPYLREIAVDHFIVPGSTGAAAPPQPAWLAVIAPAGISALAGLSRVMLVLLTTFLLSWVTVKFTTEKNGWPGFLFRQWAFPPHASHASSGTGKL